jgi:hypothetical protein
MNLLRHLIGLLGRGITSNKASTYTGQHNTEKSRTNIHGLSGIRTQDPNVRVVKIRALDRAATVADETDLCDRKIENILLISIMRTKYFVTEVNRCTAN